MSAAVSISVSGFLKSEIYKILNVTSGNSAQCELQGKLAVSDTEGQGVEIPSGSGSSGTVQAAANVAESYDVSLWSMGAWGDVQG